MTVVRCERVAEGDVDSALARIGAVTLARTPTGSFLEIRDEDLGRVSREMAFAGVRLAIESIRLEVSVRGLVVAVGRDLHPFPPSALDLDLVHLRPLPLGPETRRLLASPAWRRPRGPDRSMAQDLLQGADSLLGWRRRVWGVRGVIRSSSARRSLRPVIFDVAAIAAPPEHRIRAGERAIGRWLFG